MIVTDAKNTWGSSGSTDVLQRTDLWKVDFSRVVNGLSVGRAVDLLRPSTVGALSEDVQRALGDRLQPLEPWQAKSVTLPQKAMKVESIRRDSRSYSMPSFDEPLEASKVVFWYSSRAEAEESPVYTVLDAWFQRCRAGRGEISDTGETPVLDAFYTVEFRWDVVITLLKGASASRTDNRQLVPSSTFTLVNAWVSGFKLSDLSYEQGNQLVTIEATIQADSLERV